MSLVDAMMEDFIILDLHTENDLEGGYSSEYVEGATIRAALVLDNSMQSRVAQRDGVTSVYTITTNREVSLAFHTVLKRKKDGSIYRVTTQGGEKESPTVSTLNLSQVSAEKWELPSND